MRRLRFAERFFTRVPLIRALLPGASLARAARRLQAEAGERGLWARSAAGVREVLTGAFLDPRYALFTLFAIGLAGIFLLPASFDVMPGCGESRIGLTLFGSKAEAAEFIRTLWQVEGAVLALSITVIVFAFQAIGVSRYGASLYEFAQDTKIYPVFYWGVVGLMVDGLVLLGLGRGAPNGGAGTWAVAVSFSSLPLVALVFSGTIRALGPDRLHDRRVRRLREEVGRSVEQEIFERIALNLLEQRCDQVGVQLKLYFSDPAPEGAVVVRAPRAGRVRDIDLNRLGSLHPTSEANAASPSGSVLRVRLGQKVTRGQVIVVVPVSASSEESSASSTQKGIEKRAHGVIRLKRDEGATPNALARASERLHEEALAVIRSGSPSLYEDVLDAYEEALFAFPDAWQRYGQRFNSAAAAGLHPLGLGQTDAFLTNIAIELDEAARSSARDVAFKAAYAPARLARRAYPPDATALLKQALRLLDVVYRAAARPSPGNDDVARAVKEKVWMHLQEFADYPLAAAVESSETPPEDRRRAEAFLRQVFASYNALMKTMIEFGDLASLRATDLSWSGVFEYWTPEYEQPFHGEADLLASKKGEDDTEVLKLRRREELKRELVRAKEELVDLRTTHRYGLCMWALRRMRYAGEGERQVDPQRWARIFEYLRSHFSRVEEIVLGADLAFAAETGGDDRVPWSDWILFDLPPGPGGRRGGAVGADGEILRALVALLILSPDLESQASSVGPLGWLTGRLESALSTLDEVSQDAVLLERVFGGLDDVEQRAQIVRELLERSARLQAEAEAQALLSSDLSPEKVASFEAQAREAWLANRLAPTLFRQAGSHEAATGEPAGGHPEGWTKVEGWAPRSLFVAEREVFGGDSMAYQIGFRLADEEVRALLTKLTDAEAVAQDIRGTLEGMAKEGYEPSAIFVSNEFQFLSGVKFDDDTSASSPPDYVPERAAGTFFLGRIGGVPVFRSLHVPEGRACVADLAAFAKWHQWTVGEGGEELLIGTEEFDESRALGLAREQPSLFRTSQGQSAEDRARQIRSRVRLRLRERFEVRLKNPAAARWVNLTGGDHPE